jgi:hypothetical protein
VHYGRREKRCTMYVTTPPSPDKSIPPTHPPRRPARGSGPPPSAPSCAACSSGGTVGSWRLEFSSESEQARQVAVGWLLVRAEQQAKRTEPSPNQGRAEIFKARQRQSKAAAPHLRKLLHPRQHLAAQVDVGRDALLRQPGVLLDKGFAQVVFADVKLQSVSYVEHGGNKTRPRTRNQPTRARKQHGQIKFIASLPAGSRWPWPSFWGPSPACG